VKGNEGKEGMKGIKRKSAMNVRALCEGAIMVALAQVLGYLKLYELPFGGAVTLSMVPMFFFAIRWGLSYGLTAGLAFGILQLVFDGAFAYTWQAMILDYIVAHTLLGLTGLFRRVKYGIFYGAVLGAAARYFAHVLSGVYVWAEYMPEEFLGLDMVSPWIYSLLYNGIYMSVNLVICLLVFGVLYRPLHRYITAEDILDT